nr:MAG TPA: hypothetical protein [Caudoviricetes sp.]
MLVRNPVWIANIMQIQTQYILLMNYFLMFRRIKRLETI